MLQKWFIGLNAIQRNVVRIICYGVLGIGFIVNMVHGNALLLSVGMWLIVALVYLELKRKSKG